MRAKDGLKVWRLSVQALLGQLGFMITAARHCDFGLGGTCSSISPTDFIFGRSVKQRKNISSFESIYGYMLHFLQKGSQHVEGVEDSHHD